MNESVQQQKAALRRELLQRVKAQPPEERHRRSQVIAAQVLRSTEFQRARVIMGYSALAHEVDTNAILDAALAQGKRLALPRVVPAGKQLAAYAIRDRAHDLEPGPYGVLQPKPVSGAAVPPEAIELVIVPGVGFDRAGHRLGHGQGYYDAFLQRLPMTVPRLGLAFTCQIVERIPVDAHDEPVTTVIHD